MSTTHVFNKLRAKIIFIAIKKSLFIQNAYLPPLNCL